MSEKIGKSALLGFVYKRLGRMGYWGCYGWGGFAPLDKIIKLFEAEAVTFKEKAHQLLTEYKTNDFRYVNAARIKLVAYKRCLNKAKMYQNYVDELKIYRAFSLLLEQDKTIE